MVVTLDTIMAMMSQQLAMESAMVATLKMPMLITLMEEATRGQNTRPTRRSLLHSMSIENSNTQLHHNSMAHGL